MIIDAHVHYLDYLQETRGFDFIAKQMDEADVSHAIICGLPLVKQWDEHTQTKPKDARANDSRLYYYSATDYILMEQYQKQKEEIQKRFFPFVCGINPTDRNAVNHIRRLLEIYPNLIYGIGEIFCRHGNITYLTYGEIPRADHPALIEIYDFAADKNLPIILHNDISSFGDKEPIHLDEMNRALSHNRNTKIIWAHMGAYGTVSVLNTLEIAERMLEQNENLYYDLSVAFHHWVRKDISGWANLIQKYPNRFLLASDTVPPYEQYGYKSYYIERYVGLTNLLDEETKNKLTHGNALHLLNVQINKV